MAASLLSRLCINRVRLTNSLLSTNSRFFSAKNDGSENSSSKTDTKDVDQSEVSSKTNDELNRPNLTNESTQISSTKKYSATEQALDKFAKVVEKVKAAQDSLQPKADPESSKSIEEQNESFATMLRKSHLVTLGDVTGRLVEGKVFEVMGDDLYIDFGGKFHCVCPRPKTNANQYHRGTKVIVSLQCLEMSSAFLGSDIHVTLLEADATLLGLTSSRKNRLRSHTQS